MEGKEDDRLPSDVVESSAKGVSLTIGSEIKTPHPVEGLDFEEGKTLKYVRTASDIGSSNRRSVFISQAPQTNEAPSLEEPVVICL